MLNAVFNLCDISISFIGKFYGFLRLKFRAKF
jgi:hypothetical protein